MTIDQHSATATLSPIGVQPVVQSLSITLDEAWSPYVRVQLVCAMPAPADRDLIDIRDQDLYLSLTVRQDFGRPFSLASLTADFGGAVAAVTTFLAGGPLSRITNRYHRPWNGASVRPARRRSLRLLVTERVFDENEQSLRLTATSLEALLLGDALLSTTPFNPATTDVATIVRRVLERYELPLAADSSTATVAEPDATVWQPGVTAWDYLDPMLEAASLRLWSDEDGVFHIGDRQQAVPGMTTITPTGTMKRLADTMTLDPALWYDGVAVEYRWTDDFDLNRVEYDVAGPQPARAVRRVVKQDVRYPGPGAAAGLLNRSRGRGRVLDVEAVSDYLVTPGMAARITPPDTDAQSGYVSAVTFRLPEADMTVTTRGLVDTPETAWAFVPAGITWDDVPTGLKWPAYTPGGI